MDGLQKEAEKQAVVFTGESQDEELDSSYLIKASIPALLKTSISTEMRTHLLRQHIEIEGVARDVSLAEMGRDVFYAFAAEASRKEAVHFKSRKAENDVQFQTLKQYMPAEAEADITNLDESYDLFNDQLPNIVKSTLGIPEDGIIGIAEASEYKDKQTRANA